MDASNMNDTEIKTETTNVLRSGRKEEEESKASLSNEHRLDQIPIATDQTALELLAPSSSSSTIGSANGEKEKEKKRRMTYLKHVDDARSHSAIAQLDGHSRFPNLLHSIRQHNSAHKRLLVALLLLALNNQLLRVARTAEKELQARSAQRLPLRMMLLEEDLAAHLRNHSRRVLVQHRRRRRRVRRTVGVVIVASSSVVVVAVAVAVVGMTRATNRPSIAIRTVRC